MVEYAYFVQRVGDCFVYLAPLPHDVREMLTPCTEGYTLYLNERLTQNQRLRAIEHAFRHAQRGDFEKLNADVQEIEYSTHKGE